MKDSVLDVNLYGVQEQNAPNLMDEVERMFDRQYGASVHLSPVVSRQEARADKRGSQQTALNPNTSILVPSEAPRKAGKTSVREIIGDPLDNDQAASTRHLLGKSEGAQKKNPGMETLMQDIEASFDKRSSKKKVTIKER